MRADKRVFLTLDGLRGAAAIMIVLFHSRAIVGVFHPASAYLSVDLFFGLSGCVLEASYSGRLAAGLGTREFMLIRFLRLWPMFALGLVIALAFALMRLSWGVGHDTPWSLAWAGLTQLFLLPTPGGATDWVMPLNAAGWSLFAELVINALYARFWRYLSNGVLRWLVILSGVALAAASIEHGGVDMGSTWGSLAGGLLRVFYSFSLGVLILRAYDGRIRRGWASALPVLLLFPILAIGGGGLAYDLACTLVVLPLLVWAGLRLEPGEGLGKLFRWGGLTSYALYAIHGPTLQFVKFGIVRSLHGDPVAIEVAGLAAIAVLVGLSALLDRWYDAPLRRRLAPMLLRRPKRVAAEPAMSAP
jgi:peptidoglycan/LPS O-acetylase OafA/YrhL